MYLLAVSSFLPSLFFFLFFYIYPVPLLSQEPHTILFRSLNLYPESLAWDPSAQHFVVGSLRHSSIDAVSDAGVVQTLISDPSLPTNASILGLAVDYRRHRLLAVIHAADPLPQFDALASYDLLTRRRFFLASLPDPESPKRRPIANDVTFDPDGNVFVTNSAGNFIWRVNLNASVSIFSRSAAFSAYPVQYGEYGLTGIAYVSKGYLLAVQSSTGKMFKVCSEGSARAVPLKEDLKSADGIAIRSDGVVVVVSPEWAWFVKSDDSWGGGAVYDKTALNVEGFPTSVTVGAEDRVYAIYGYVEEGIRGNAEREWFGIEEIRAESEGKEEGVWVFVLIGLGLAYFLFWRFQMAQLVKNMNKKTS